MSSRIKSKKDKAVQILGEECQSPGQNQFAAGIADTTTENNASKSEGFRKILAHSENAPVVRKLIVATVLMFTMPFMFFYLFKYIDYLGFPLMHMYFKDRDVVGALGALVAIQVIVITYVYIGLTEKDDRETPSKSKKD